MSSPVAQMCLFRCGGWRMRKPVFGYHGRFSLANVQGRKIYCLQLSTPGFDPLRLRVQVDRKRGANLKLKLTIAT
jgi:hypothetical protein